MKKENLKENIVEASTLFVGVGGTGSDIVNRVARMCKPGETENIGFVCLDTNVNDLNNVDNNAKIHTVQTSTTQTVGDYLDYDSDALRNWFPKNAVMYDKTVSEGAGQVRAISRLAFNSTIKTGKIEPLYTAIDELFRKDGKKLKQAMRVVIVSTASGGTGSGIILPISMFIRDYINNKYPQTGTIIRAMILLPETLDSVIKSAVERDSQRRNAYATIKEINAFMMKGSGFCNIDGEFMRYSDLHVDVPVAGTEEKKSLSLLPCDFCFLLDGQNSEDNTLVNLEQYKVQAAQALYEQNIGPMQKGAFSVEDNIIKEMSNPGNMGRNRFGGIGASVLIYPYEKIAEYIAYGWAMESIGGEGKAAKWSKYDKEYEVKIAEARKKGLSQTEAPKLEEVYTSTLINATDTFSKDIRGQFLTDAPSRINRYFSALADYMHKTVEENAQVRAALNAAGELKSRKDYQNNAGNRGRAVDNLGRLRDYEGVVRLNAKKVAESAAEALFMNEDKTINAKLPHTLEFLLKNSYGEICHPNAARYMLYLAKQEFSKRVLSNKSRLDNQVDNILDLYSPEAEKENMFDVKKTRKEKEVNLDEFAAAEASYNGAYNEDYYTKLNKHFVGYYQAIEDYSHMVADQEAYRIGFEYISELCKAYEKFYRTFTDKVTSLERKRGDIVDELEFKKGDSSLNICASREMLAELYKTTRHQSEEGSLLSSELNGQIFDAVKKNVAFEREIRNADIVEKDERIDIFDDIILGYFKESVIKNCETIDLNIIEAIAMENRLLARIKMREEQESSDEKLFDKVTHSDNELYIKKIIDKGMRLAAPGIQSIPNEEPRRVECCAYNSSLLDMRNYRVRDLIKISNSGGYDSISRYEMHFFIALYNITPDKLKKFSCHSESETGEKDAGLYHNAYVKYARNIGPDSTKDTLISTHIDKRWDSIAVMPEIDFNFQKVQMMRIHQAMVYSLVHKAVTFRRLSVTAGLKKVYRYENSDEKYLDLIVSNGTMCDEFYEILDSLYISSAIVEDIEKVKEKKKAKDKVRNANYKETVFYKDLHSFNVEVFHEGICSLFEIPVVYYNSLPNSRRFNDELSAVVDAVIKTLRDEIYSWESANDARFLLCDELYDQFMLLMDNYEKWENLRGNMTARDNPMIDIIYRKIKAVLSCDPEPDALEDKLEKMKARIS